MLTLYFSFAHFVVFFSFFILNRFGEKLALLFFYRNAAERTLELPVNRSKKSPNQTTDFAKITSSHRYLIFSSSSFSSSNFHLRSHDNPQLKQTKISSSHLPTHFAILRYRKTGKKIFSFFFFFLRQNSESITHFFVISRC